MKNEFRQSIGLARCKFIGAVRAFRRHCVHEMEYAQRLLKRETIDSNRDYLRNVENTWRGKMEVCDFLLNCGLHPVFDKYGTFSFCPQNRNRYNPKHRQETTLGKFLSRNFRYVPCADVASLENALRQAQFKVFRGKDVSSAYYHEVGSGSCMAGTNGDVLTELYAINPEVVGLAVLWYGRGDMTIEQIADCQSARALVWDNGKAIFLDRIYSSACLDRKLTDAVLRHYKDRTVLSRGQDFSVVVKAPKKAWPYLDSLPWVTEEPGGKYKLSSEHSEEAECCQDTGGCGPNTDSIFSCCEICDGDCNNDDITVTNDGRHVCESCYNEDYTTCDNCDEETHRDDTRQVHNSRGWCETWCSSCASDAYECDNCCEQFEDKLTTVKERRGTSEFCPECVKENTEKCCCCKSQVIDTITNDRDGDIVCDHCLAEYDEEHSEETASIES